MHSPKGLDYDRTRFAEDVMRVFAPLLIACLFVFDQAASLQTRSISGTVVDPAGQAIPGVAIELRKGTTVAAADDLRHSGGVEV